MYLQIIVGISQDEAGRLGVEGWLKVRRSGFKVVEP